MPDAAVLRLERAADAQAARIAELEARIALLESEARSARGGAPAGKLTRTVKIGRGAQDRLKSRFDARGRSDGQGEVETEEEVDNRPPIRLRLHGRPQGQEGFPDGGKPELEPVPVVHERLSVVPLPGQSAAGPTAATSSSQRLPAHEQADARGQYKDALGMLQRREYGPAATAFRLFVQQHPHHGLIGSALYWQAEAHYALRAYREALGLFESVVTRFPDSNKVASSLYKAGLCHQRLGDSAAAARFFKRLRAQFPDSELAARLSVEGSS